MLVVTKWLTIKGRGIRLPLRYQFAWIVSTDQDGSKEWKSVNSEKGTRRENMKQAITFLIIFSAPSDADYAVRGLHKLTLSDIFMPSTVNTEGCNLGCYIDHNRQ